MRWKDLFLNDYCIICGEKTSYYVCDKCREAVMQVRDKIYPPEEELDTEDLFISFFKKRKKHANRS